MLRGLVKLISLVIFFSVTAVAQTDTSYFSEEYDESDNKILLRKEWSFSGIAHSGGFGVGYRNGRHITAYKKRMLELDIVGMKHPKEIKSINPFFENSKSYVYGKINNLFIIRPGIGIQKVINNKPLWGGVEVRYFYYGGMSLAITKPVYLYIINFSPVPYKFVYTVEQYNPDEHFFDNIYGRGPFSKGFNKLSLHPGAYAKAGLNFEYGTEDRMLRVLEVGAVLDVYPKPVPLMAFNNADYYFLSFYLSLNFGQRKY